MLFHLETSKLYTNIYFSEFLDEDGNNIMEEDSECIHVFEATKIQKSPLVTVRSKAHSDKLSVNSNDICVSLLEAEVCRNVITLI